MTSKNSAHNVGKPMSDQIANPTEIEPTLVGSFWEGWLSKTSEETTLEACQQIHSSLRPSAEAEAVSAAPAVAGAEPAASVPAVVGAAPAASAAPADAATVPIPETAPPDE